MDKLFNPDYIKQLCIKYGLRPSRQYGQNFLLNPAVIEKMLEAAELKETDTVVEIGPGFGVLTFPLAERADKVLTYEIEKKLAPYWDERVKQYPNIRVEWGNVLKINPEAENGKWKYKVVANLPYQITSAVIRQFLESENPPESMVLMVQREVAERICAEKGDMSLLSVAVQYYAEPKIVALVPRSDFWPEPKVDSAVIIINNIKSDKNNLEFDNNFFRLVRAGFANRRKLLIKNLEAVAGKTNKEALKNALSGLHFKETVRAQELGVEDWNNLAARLYDKL